MLGEVGAPTGPVRDRITGALHAMTFQITQLEEQAGRNDA